MVKKFFFYGTLMNIGYLSLLIPNSKILDVKPGYIFGKMYSIYKKYPVTIRANEGKKAKNPCIVYGAIVTIDLNVSDYTLLDRFESCSKATIGQNLDTDIYHRVKATATEIEFDDMIDFTQYKYSTGDKHKVEVYIGNMKNDTINKICMNERRSGNVWRTFFSAFQ